MILYSGTGTDGKQVAAELLARAVEAFSGLKPLPQISRLPGGKPFFPAYPQLHFNLSHSGSFALCAVADVSLGVDIETVRPRGAHLPRYTMSDAEYRWYVAQGARWADFYTVWTCKEARAKLEGTGLNCPPREIAVPLLSPGEAGTAEGALFRAYRGEGWRGAVCAGAGTVLPEKITQNFNFS